MKTTLEMLSEILDAYKGPGRAGPLDELRARVGRRAYEDAWTLY